MSLIAARFPANCRYNQLVAYVAVNSLASSSTSAAAAAAAAVACNAINESVT